MFKKVVAAIEVIAAIAAVVFVVMLFAAQPDDSGAAGGAGGGDGGAYLAETGALPTTGQEIFSVRCSGCHGANGQGGTGPRLASRVTDEFPDIEDEIAVVTDGQGLMPSFSGSLSDADIRLVVEYTRTGLGN